MSPQRDHSYRNFPREIPSDSGIYRIAVFPCHGDPQGSLHCGAARRALHDDLRAHALRTSAYSRTEHSIADRPGLPRLSL
jgi:hypothetical protein